jgi:serine/threonine-protein kinase HipA
MATSSKAGRVNRRGGPGGFLEAFRRMVFNILAHNRDDHTKNFAFRMSATGEWRLAPAYDVTYSMGLGGEHTMMVAGAGPVPTRAHVDAVAEAASLESREVREVLERVQAAVAQWPVIAARHGVAPTSVRTIQRRLDTVQDQFDDGSAAPLARARGRVRRRGSTK